MNLPNKLTVGRVIAVPFFIAAYLMGYYPAALVIFICAALTDALDGKILCLFIESDIIKAWMLIIILAREFVVAGMRTVAASEGTVLAAGMSGKIKTVLQMVAVVLYLFALCLTDAKATVMMIANYVFYASLVMTVYSGAEYVLKNRSVFSM